MNEFVSRLITHRERFQSWGLVISFLSLVAAVWTRAPEQEVEIPLFAGAKAAINAGYVVSFGPTFIALSLFWALGALVSMRRYQVGLMNSGKHFEACELVSILGPLSDDHKPSMNKEKKFHYIHKLTRKVRSFSFFVLPIVSQLVIINTMFMDLAFYDKVKFVENITLKTSTDRIKESSTFHPKDVKDLGYWVFFSKVTAKEGADYTLSFNDLNENCGMYFYLEYLNERISNLTKSETKDRNNLKEIEPSCAALNFPNFHLAANTWVNLLMLLVTIIVSLYGSYLYAGKGLIFNEISKQEKTELTNK